MEFTTRGVPRKYFESQKSQSVNLRGPSCQNGYVYHVYNIIMKLMN